MRDGLVRNCRELLRGRVGDRKLLGGNFVLPLLGFFRIALDADAFAIHFRQATLGNKMPLFSGFAAPLESFFVIARHATTFAEEFANFGLGCGNTVESRAQKPFVRFVKGLLAVFAGLVNEAEAIFAVGVAFFGAGASVLKAAFFDFGGRPGAHTTKGMPRYDSNPRPGGFECFSFWQIHTISNTHEPTCPSDAGSHFRKQTACQKMGLKADFVRFSAHNDARSRVSGLPVGFDGCQLDRLAVAGAKIGKTLTTSGYDTADFAFHDLGGGVPKGVILEISRGVAKSGLKSLDPLIHDMEHYLSGCLGIGVVGRIRDTPPFQLADLITADFAGASDRMVIIASFQHRKRGRPIHAERTRWQQHQ